MEANNTFSKGQTSDVSKLLQSPDTYLKAVNFRPVGDIGKSTGALVNIRGNNCEMTFPQVRGVFKLSPQKDTLGKYKSGVITITINGQTTAPITINENTIMSEIYNQILLLPNCYNNTNNTNVDFAVAYNDIGIYIYQQPVYSSCSPVASIEPIITQTTISGTAVLEFEDYNGTLTTSYTAFIPACANSSKLVVIGSTFINETIYLFTTHSNPTSSEGQIWEYTYDEITKVSTIKLIYSNKLNFTIDYPIAPSAALGRYEIDSIQRLFWTDFNNPVRTLNAKQENLMALDVDLINLRPSVLMSKPTLTNVLQGQAVQPLQTDMTYQCSYRLVKNNGTVTNYSVCSDLVYVTSIDTNFVMDQSRLDFCSLKGDTVPVSVNKALEFRVDGIDTDYDTIEFVIVERQYPNTDTFNVFKYEEQLINGRTEITSVYRRPHTMESITIQDFLLENTTFTHCKTIESKDNRLFFANVKNSLVDRLKTYDTRAYRFGQLSTSFEVLKFESDTNATIYNASGSFPNLTLPTLDTKLDLIPVYNLGVDTLDDSRFKPIMFKYNSNIIGGTGANIQYSFGTELIRSDFNITEPNTISGSTRTGTDLDTLGSPQTYVHGYRIPYRKYNGSLAPTFSNGAPYQLYTTNNTKQTMGTEYFSGTYKSYQQNEIYRFAIVFYSRTGESSFAKWIGDIKFPNFSDLADPALAGQTDLGNTCPDFRSLYKDASGAYNVLPYIQFEVNIPADLASMIDGYEIVRVQRTELDRTVLDYGLITQCATGGGSHNNDFYLPVPHQILTDGSNICNPLDYTPGTYNKGYSYLMAFHGFNTMVDGFNNKQITYEADDKVVVTEKYAYILDNPVWPDAVASANPEEEFYIAKFYTQNGFHYTASLIPNNVYKITENSYVGIGVATPTLNQLPTPGVYYNRDWDSSAAPAFTDTAYSLGCPALICVIDKNSSGIIWGNYGVVDPGTHNTSKLFAMYFKPSRLKNQYGGRGYISRTNNEYITTGALYPVESSGVKTIKVFGGDIYSSILDMQKCIKNWNQTGVNTAARKCSQTWFIPVQSVYNPDLRDGSHINRDLNGNSVNAAVTDDYYYPFGYSMENTIRTFYPEPAFFNETNKWVNRIYWSNVKINGENSDSWSTIPVLNYYDVEGAYGGINALSILQNKMYYIQERGFGYLYINPITTISGNNGLPVTLGKGDTVEKHEYLSIDAGTKHQWSVFRSNSAITFIDARHKKIYLFNGESLNPVSDTKFNRSFINKVLHDDLLINDNPIKFNGILTTYDYINNEFLYTFHCTMNETDITDQYTLVYSDITDSFSGFYSFVPYIYVNNHNKLLSLKDWSSRSSTAGKLYMHNIGNYGTFYGTIYPSSLKVNLNNNPLYTKIYDNISWISDSVKENVKYIDDTNDWLQESDDIPYLNDTIKRLRCYNEYQNSDWITLDTTPATRTLRKSEQGWNVQIPRNKVNYDTTAINTKSIFDPTILTKTSFKDRLRDKYMIVDLEYDNVLNNRFTLHNLKSVYRISDR